jgi:hypothetical protein
MFRVTWSEERWKFERSRKKMLWLEVLVVGNPSTFQRETGSRREKSTRIGAYPCNANVCKDACGCLSPSAFSSRKSQLQKKKSFKCHLNQQNRPLLPDSRDVDLRRMQGALPANPHRELSLFDTSSALDNLESHESPPFSYYIR